MNTQAPSNPSLNPSVTPDASWGDLNNAYSTANQNNITANSANTRQSLVNNQQIPQMQSSYDDLAKQLFNYDTGVLNPQFAGTNAGTPADATQFGRVAASPLAMTPDSLNNPVGQALSAFNTNPKYAYTSQTDQSDSLINMLTNINSRIGNSLGLAGAQNHSDVSAALAALTGISGIMKEKTQLGIAAESHASTIDRTLLQMGLANVDENGNIIPVNTQQTADTVSKEDRQSVQNYYTNLPIGSPLRNKIASSWKAANNNNLFPDTLPQKSQDELSQTINAYNTITNVINMYDKYKDKFPQGKLGQYEQGLLSSGLAGTPILGNLLQGGQVPADLQQAITQMIALRGSGERTIIGGRLTGYLLNILGPAFPGAQNPADLSKAQLQTAKTNLDNQLNIFAKSSGFNNTQELINNYGLTMEPDTTGQNATYTSGNSSQTPTINRQTIVSNLKAKGYSDDDIHTYLRQKGIDK